MKIVDIANEIYNELDQPSDLSIPAIAFWLKTNIGQLVLLLDLETTVVNGEFEPELGITESEIFKVMYETNYTERQIRKNLGAASYDSVLEVKEGGRTIRVVNKNDIAKSFMTIKDGLNDRLNQLILAYKMNAVSPVQIYVDNPVSQSGGFGLEPGFGGY